MTNSTIDLVARCHDTILGWSTLSELAEFAERGHGYGFDGGGITYPEDLDEHERVVERVQIPEGFLLVYGYGRDDVLVPKATYLRVLRDVLAGASLDGEETKVHVLLGTGIHSAVEQHRLSGFGPSPVFQGQDRTRRPDVGQPIYQGLGPMTTSR